jgi:hypothetical protein
MSEMNSNTNQYFSTQKKRKSNAQKKTTTTTTTNPFCKIHSFFYSIYRGEL